MRLSELAERIGGELIGDGAIEISGVAGIEDARKGDITFLGHPKYESYLETTEASAIILGDSRVRLGAAVIRNPNPRLAFQKAMMILHGDRLHPVPGIHPTAVLGAGCDLGEDVSIGPHVVISERAIVGDRAVIQAGCFIGPGAEIGAGSYVYPNVVIRERTVLGRDNIIHAGAVIGDDGFGIVKDGSNGHQKVPQVGRVILGDHVEVGANACIDRATMGETRVGDDTRIDNLVQIAHNVKIGSGVILCAQVGIAGSCEIGDNTILAGQVGVGDHKKIGKGVMVGAQAGVTRNIPDDGRYSGYPARPHMESQRIVAASKRTPELLRRLDVLERRLAELESNQKPEVE